MVRLLLVKHFYHSLSIYKIKPFGQISKGLTAVKMHLYMQQKVQ